MSSKLTHSVSIHPLVCVNITLVRFQLIWDNNNRSLFAKILSTKVMLKITTMVNQIVPSSGNPYSTILTRISSKRVSSALNNKIINNVTSSHFLNFW